MKTRICQLICMSHCNKYTIGQLLYSLAMINYIVSYDTRHLPCPRATCNFKMKSRESTLQHITSPNDIDLLC